jgi:hypothetical protein
MNPRHLLAITPLAVLLAFTGCSIESVDNTQREALKAARASCPDGVASVKFHNAGTKSLERVVCRPPGSARR